MNKRLILLATLAGSSMACGDDKGGSEAKCEDLIERYCGRVVSCAVQGNVLSATVTAESLRDNCTQVLGDGAHCGDAVDVTRNYASCLDMAQNLDCAASNGSLVTAMKFATPAVCEGVIVYDP